MDNYKHMYQQLFNVVTKTVSLLQDGQQLSANSSTAVPETENTTELLEMLYHAKNSGIIDVEFANRHQEKVDLFGNFMKPFYSQLSEQQKIDFDDIMRAHYDLVESELEHSFSDGFKMGAKIMSEVFQ